MTEGSLCRFFACDPAGEGSGSYPHVRRFDSATSDLFPTGPDIGPAVICDGGRMSIYRWLSDDTDQESILLPVPSDCLNLKAVEFAEAGVSLREIPPSVDPVEFPLVHIWDDPSRSPHLQRVGLKWQDEDTLGLLRLWEQTRLEQFYKHLFRDYKSMQVVYLMPPHAEVTHFNHEGEFYQGWRIEMVAAIFSGFVPTLNPWSFGVQPKIIAPEKPKLRLV